jgi:hypothetical protein
VRFQKELATAEKFVRHNPLLGQPHKFETIESVSLQSHIF